MGDKLLRISNVYFSYESEHVLEDISFDVKKGEIIGIAGPNGAGKTTILKLIVGLLKPSRGRIEKYYDADTSKNPQAISYLPQHVQRVEADFPATVREVVEMGLYKKVGIMGRFNTSDKTAVEEAIKNVELERYRNAQITELSGGLLQRAFIARALVSKPSILILDEPTAAVDIAGEERFYKLIKKINRLYGVAVLLVSHDVYVLLEHTTRLIFVNRRILYDGNPEDLSSSKLLNLLFYHRHSKSFVKRLERSREKILKVRER